MASHDKPCTLCGTPRGVLVRCQIDASGRWHLLCPGACWRQASGGQEDARGAESAHPYYRYGGMWKNRHVDGPASARKPRRVKERQKREQKEKTRDDDAGAKDQEGDEAVQTIQLSRRKSTKQKFTAEARFVTQHWKDELADAPDVQEESA